MRRAGRGCVQARLRLISARATWADGLWEQPRAKSSIISLLWSVFLALLHNSRPRMPPAGCYCATGEASAVQPAVGMTRTAERLANRLAAWMRGSTTRSTEWKHGASQGTIWNVDAIEGSRSECSPRML